MSKRTIVLIILDGFGIGKNDQSNPIYIVNPKNINHLKENFPFASLQASGIAVGLPWKEEGNSEVGHLTLGAGKVVYQNYPRITLAIRDQSFFKNEIIKKAFDHAKQNNSAVNLIGLLSDGNIHSSFEHIEALIKFAENEQVKNLNIHLITDGRDSPPTSSIDLLKKLPELAKNNLATIAGRYYAMDRDKHWDRTQKYYQVLIGEGIVIEGDIENYIKNTYQKKLNDEYVLPAIISKEKNIKDNDSIIFFNFREDRMRQIVDPFINKNFTDFPIKDLQNIFIATMVSYSDQFNAPAIYLKEIVENPLSKILSDNDKFQFKIAETEKYAHITYFFNGEKEAPFKNEYRILIPSKAEFHPESHPEMMADEITNRVIEAITEQSYDFILANYANPDIIAHTGNYEASLKAVEVIDEQVGKITKAVLENNAILIITSDHGNIERVVNSQTGEPETKHDISPVPIHLVAKEFEKRKSIKEIKQAEKLTIGILADVAPTILELINLPKPKEMTGQSLLRYLIS